MSKKAFWSEKHNATRDAIEELANRLGMKVAMHDHIGKAVVSYDTIEDIPVTYRDLREVRTEIREVNHILSLLMKYLELTIENEEKVVKLKKHDK